MYIHDGYAFRTHSVRVQCMTIGQAFEGTFFQTDSMPVAEGI